MTRAFSWVTAGVLTCAALAGCYGFPSDDEVAKPPSNRNGAPLTATPLARLTSTQLELTLRDLFAPTPIPAVTLPVEGKVEGFDTNTAAQTPSAILIEDLRATAITVAEAVMKTPQPVLGCAPTSPADEETCAQSFVAKFTARAYRRPLAPEEQASLLTLYHAFRSDGSSFVTSMTLVLEAILQSPAFVYRLENAIGPSESPGRVRIGAYELANRLSYFFWNTMPDAELAAAAANGELDTRDGVEKQARRLLADPRARASFSRFHGQWLKLDRIASVTKNSTLYPGFTTKTASSLGRSAFAFAERSFFEDGHLGALLTDDHAFVDAETAALFGVTSPGATMSFVPVDKTQRAGILTHPGVLAALGNESEHSPILRGVYVLDGFLCAPPPPPPKNVPPPPAPNAAQPKTTRERLSTQHEQGTCADCHHRIDGVGFAFEHYDATGAWRTKDSGFDVDASGWFPAGSDPAGTFDGAVELARKLAASRAVESCVAEHWYRYALGVASRDVDSAQLGPIVDQFVARDSDMRELVIALVTSEAFRSRIEDR
jgi:hypothetical protein